MIDVGGEHREAARDVNAVVGAELAEGVLGLDDRSHARKPGVRTVDLRAMLAVRALQENPELGEFRVHAALKQVGIDLSPRTCGRILALNRALYGRKTYLKNPEALEGAETKE